MALNQWEERLYWFAMGMGTNMLLVVLAHNIHYLFFS